MYIYIYYKIRRPSGPTACQTCVSIGTESADKQKQEKASAWRDSNRVPRDARQLFHGIPTVDHGGTNHSDLFYPVHHFFSPGSVFLHDLFLRIAEKGEGEFKFIGESAVRFRSVRRDADDDRIEFVQLLLEVTEAARFLRSARRVVFGIEPENEVFSFEVLERHSVAVRVGQGESGRLFAFRYFCHRDRSSLLRTVRDRAGGVKKGRRGSPGLPPPIGPNERRERRPRRRVSRLREGAPRIERRSGPALFDRFFPKRGGSLFVSRRARGRSA